MPFQGQRGNYRRGPGARVSENSQGSRRRGEEASDVSDVKSHFPDKQARSHGGLPLFELSGSSAPAMGSGAILMAST